MHEEDNALNKFTFSLSPKQHFSVPLEKLAAFLAKDPNPVLIFYGGEPLLQPKKIHQIMGRFDVPYRMQTNGLLLHTLPPQYLNRITKIIISIDGDRDRTDYNRGKGTYETIIHNMKRARDNGYRGELIARMTISGFPDVDKQVMHLFDAGFDAVHWQLDAGFYKADYSIGFAPFANEYNSAVSRLVSEWMTHMRNGRILLIYPFVGIVASLLSGEKTKLRCGAGHSGYAIGTDGTIFACPIMNGFQEFIAGTLDDSSLRTFDVEGNCETCDIRDVCGGRCLYWQAAQLWPDEGNKLICQTIRHLIHELEARIPEIRTLINTGMIAPETFSYEKYFGPEIIP